SGGAMWERVGAVLRRVFRWGPGSSPAASGDVATVMGREPVALPPVASARRVECDRAGCRAEASRWIKYQEAGPHAEPDAVGTAIVCEAHWAAALRALDRDG